MRKHVQDKYNPVVKEKDLLHVNPKYAAVQFPDEREVTVSATPTPAGPGEANESPSLAQSNETPFSTLKRTDSGLHHLPGTNDSDN